MRDELRSRGAEDLRSLADMHISLRDDAFEGPDKGVGVLAFRRRQQIARELLAEWDPPS